MDLPTKRRSGPLSRRGRRRASGLAATASVVMLATGCGSGVSVSSRDLDSARSTGYRQSLAFAHCMQAHGLTRFPDPSRSEKTGPGVQLVATPGSPVARATSACKLFLAAASRPVSGATATTSSPPNGMAADCLTGKTCYAPRQFLTAYGVEPVLRRGITGRGVTVVLPEQAETGRRDLSP